MAKYCMNCGLQLSETAVFCTSCGTRVQPPAQAVQPTQQVNNTPIQPVTSLGAQPQQINQPQYIQYGNIQPQQPVYAPVQPVQQYPPAQQQQPVQNPGLSLKQQTLYNAPYALNRPDQPWEATVEGDAIVARWKWMDARFFSPNEVSNETRNYTFTVFLSDNGTFREVDVTENKKSGMSMSGGKLSFGSSSSSFKGKTTQKSFSMGVGQNNQTGETGIVTFKFDTNSVKQPIRNYLFSCGFRK